MGAIQAEHGAFVDGEAHRNRTSAQLRSDRHRGAAARSRRPDLLLVEPDVFHAPAVEDAIGGEGHPHDVRLPTGRPAPIEDDRPSNVFGQFSFDLPNQPLPLLGVRFSRLLLD
jgi:hypothetical protein